MLTPAGVPVRSLPPRLTPTLPRLGNGSLANISHADQT